MIDTMGVILTSHNDSGFGEITRMRSVAAIPFAGRYRLIDFVLSSMVNSGIINVGVATEYNFQSLMDHLGSGKPWGLARKKYGLTFLPPFAKSSANDGDEHMKSLYSILHYIKRSQQKYIIVADCNNVCNLHFDAIVAEHKESGADLTVVYQKQPVAKHGTYVAVDGDKVQSIVASKDCVGESNRLVGYYVFTKDLLINTLERFQLLGKKYFVGDLINTYIEKHDVRGYCFEGYLATIEDINDYYNVSMQLMDSSVRKSLFIGENRILTKVMDRVPTKYLGKASVKNSMIADGCVINGKVENSILFRGVVVEEGAVIKDSIVMQNSVISANVRIGACIIDKDCIIRKDKELVGQPNFPIVVGKHRTI